MSVTQGNENIIQGYIRAAYQRGGPGPNNDVEFAGERGQYLMMGDASVPDRGSINALNIQDPMAYDTWKRTGYTSDAPDIPSGSVTFKQKRGGPPWYRFRLDCPINFYEVIGFCNQPSDLTNGWNTMMAYSRGISTDKTYAGRAGFDSNEESTNEVAFSWTGGVYEIGGITLGEFASQEVTTEVVDIVYGNNQNCSDCGPVDDGTRRIYALQQTSGGSSAAVAIVKYSLDYGATWADSAITGLGVGSLATAIRSVGQYLVVLVSAENAYYISQINRYTGAPGTWTKITAGFVAAKTPNDMYVANASRVYFVANGGYIYQSTDLLSGVEVLSAGNASINNLNRIHGQGQYLVAVGASNTILKSSDYGRTWAATTASVTGTLQAVAVKSAMEFWVGTSAGGVWYTENAGESWTAKTLPGSAVAAIHDIVWATAEFGYIAASRTGPTGTIFALMFGGESIVEAPSSRLPQAPSYGRPNRIAVPLVSDPMVAAGNIAVGGLAGNLTDGVVYLGQTPIL
jgi:hypothetical protein